MQIKSCDSFYSLSVLESQELVYKQGLLLFSHLLCAVPVNKSNILYFTKTTWSLGSAKIKYPKFGEVRETKIYDCALKLDFLALYSLYYPHALFLLKQTPMVMKSFVLMEINCFFLSIYLLKLALFRIRVYIKNLNMQNNSKRACLTITDWTL